MECFYHLLLQFELYTISMISNLNTTLLLISLLVAHTCALYINISQQPFCMLLPALSSSSYHIAYESISQPSTLAVTIATPTTKLVINAPANQTIMNASQQISVCFEVGTGMEPVSIDAYSSAQYKYKELALKSHVQEVHEELIGVGAQLKEITRQQKFDEQRQIIQSQIITQHENNIYMYSIIKVFLVLAVIGGQFFILRHRIAKSTGEFFNF